MHRLLVVLAIATVGCKKHDPDKSRKSEPGATASTAGDPCEKPHRAQASAAGGAARADAREDLGWIHDDYTTALACAKARRLPLVLDLWAPWCHTCLSMQTTVFTDATLVAKRSGFVFAALDTDRDVNAAAVAKFPLSAWPTFYVIGPDEAVLARFVGAASVAQFHAFLDTGARAMAGGATGPDERLLAAERAIAAKDHETAILQLANAIAVAPADWPRRPDALVSLIGLERKRNSYTDCLSTAEKWLDETGNAASASDFMSQAMRCAEEHLKIAKDPDQAARVRKLRERAIARWQKLVADESAPLSVDDRSDAMALLRETLIAIGKPDDAKAVAEQQRALLDATAAKAPSPMAAMTYNWPRAEVYVYLQRPLELVAALEKSAADLPKEYDPPARLGWIYFKAGKLEDAAQSTDKSLALVYGPRKVRVLTQRAEIAAAQHDKPGEKRFREAIVNTLESLPPGQAPPDALAKAKQVLADLDKPATGSGSAAPPK